MTKTTITIEKLPNGGFIINDNAGKPVAARSSFTEAMAVIDDRLAEAFSEPMRANADDGGGGTREMASRFQKPAPPPPGVVANIAARVRGVNQ